LRCWCGGTGTSLVGRDAGGYGDPARLDHRIRAIRAAWLVTVALAEIGTIMLGYLSTPEQAGIFRIASRAFLIASFVAIAMPSRPMGRASPRIGRRQGARAGTALTDDERGGTGGRSGVADRLRADRKTGSRRSRSGPEFEAAYLARACHGDRRNLQPGSARCRRGS
jgi:hypothetical protein